MTVVAFLGLGRMGRPMAVNVRKAGFDLVVWNRPAEKATEFALAGKDLRNAPQPAASVGADLPHTAGALKVLESAAEAGFGEDDESAVAQYLRTTNGSR